jgi:hypothetical protein
MDRYEGEIYEVPEFIPADDEDDTDLLLEGPDLEDDGLVYDLRTHAYVYDSHGDKHEAEPILRPAITWGDPDEIEVIRFNGEIVPRAPWERPEEYSPAAHVFSEVERDPIDSDVMREIYRAENEPLVYRVDVRFANGVAAVISFPSVEARDAFLAGEEIENYRIEGEDL